MIKHIPDNHQVLTKSPLLGFVDFLQGYFSINQLSSPKINTLLRVKHLFSWPIILFLFQYLLVSLLNGRLYIQLIISCPIAIQHEILVDKLSNVKIKQDLFLNCFFTNCSFDDDLHQRDVIFQWFTNWCFQVNTVR